MKDDFLNLSLGFIRKAGELSLKHFGHSRPSFKPDRSIITTADRAVSNLLSEYLKDYLKTKDHILIDEERPESKQYLKNNALKNAPYVWSVDPIDGTRLYANNMPLFGISIGLIKEGKPYIGAVYFPVLRELFWADDRNAYFVSNPFTASSKTKIIKPIRQKIDSLSVLLCDDAIFKDYQWDYKDCQLMVPTCAVVDLCWPAIGRACGSIFCSYLWDFAGSWPIVEKAGLSFRSLKTGKSLKNLSAEDFDAKDRPWKLKEFYILSSEENYNIIKKKFRPR